MEEEKMDQRSGVVKQEEEDVELPGFRFHPTDEELVGFYLRRKVEKKPFSIEIIRQVDIYKYSPWDLPKVSTVGGEKEWYFFCLRGRKYRNSIRPNRVTGSGFWKATGIDRPIYPTGDSGTECIGLKKSLVYYRGSAGKGTKTDWMMHEFRLPTGGNKNGKSPSIQEAEIWTICRIFKRNVPYKKYPAAPTKKQVSTYSSSKTASCCFGSDTGEQEYKCFGSSSILGGEMKLITSYHEENNPILARQWNHIVQPPLTTLRPNIPNPSTNEFFKDHGNWDELGRIMEYMMEPGQAHEWRNT